MTGNFIDNIRYRWKSLPLLDDGFFYLDTDFGKIRVFDTGGNRPTIVNVPDGPNVIEHQIPLIKKLANDYRVVCFEYPGLGFSFPDKNYDYSFKSGANLLLQVMNLLDLQKVSLIFSCSNGYYALTAAIDQPDRFQHIFLSQTPSIEGIKQWTEKSIPKILKVPILGQLTNAMSDKKLASLWYQYALPKNHPDRPQFVNTAKSSLQKGGCFCLSSLVQGLQKDSGTSLHLAKVPTTLVWGAKDFTHRKTDKESIKEHVENCDIIEWKECGHFPELESTKDYVQLVKERNDTSYL